jgi:ABC-type dipeptide/oligopeptide/nickel transport system permease component
LFVAIRVGPRFLLRRIAGVIFVVFGVTFITFILGYFAPGNAILTTCGSVCPKLTKSLENYYDHLYDHLYGRDVPWYVQYGRFMNNLLHFNLGHSYIYTTQTVRDILGHFVPVSAQLTASAIVLAIVVAVPLGLNAALHSNSAYDTGVRTASLVLFVLPPFLLIPFYRLLMVTLHDHGLPSLAVTGWDSWQAMVGPIIFFGAGIFAYFLRVTRASMLGALRQDYVRSARAKGLTERRVIWRHAFRNTLMNLLTAVGPALAIAVAGIFVVELLFNIPGLGMASLTAINQRDYPVLQGVVILIALAIVCINLITDIAYGLVDPRIKTQ